ncbi:MAG: Ribosomal large subunit pseudouridine synthase C [Steroidobacteraceae bacterium]|nr:Ribosomal large subunit pseudouridine synthase C [Steroidobacteraceae bacterium]
MTDDSTPPITPARSPVRQVEVTDEGAGLRLDRYLAKTLPQVPLSHVFRLIRKGEVRVNGKRAPGSLRLQAGDIVRVPPVREAPPAPKAGEGMPPRRVPPRLLEEVRAAVLQRDESLLVVNKPAGLAVHGGSGVSFGVIEALRAAYPDDKLELVHRLDRDTSGCLLVARKASALRTLHALLREHAFEKRYLALVVGKWDLGKKRIDMPLRTDLRVGGERTVKAHASGKGAISDFRPVQFFGSRASLLEVSIRTGRTHQIRVHAAYAGHPVAGDEKYGDEAANEEFAQFGLRRMFLHASSVSFTWPQSGTEFSVNAPLPADLAAVIDRLAAAPVRGRRGPRGARPKRAR